MNRVLVLSFIVTVVAIAVWDILRRNPQLLSGLRPPSPQPGRRTRGRPTVAPAKPPPARGQVIELRRDPYQVLGIDRDTPREELDAHVERIRQENDPAKLEGLSDELRAHAERRVAEVESAYTEIIGRS